ncbi:MAG: response regulator [Pseudomonadota bacterium]
MTTVLIVDDSPTELHILQDMLSRNGFQTLIAEDGDSAIEQALEHTPDAILMDVVMPGTNGFQATRQITRHPETASIPVIMVTTKDQATDKIWGMRQGATDYLTKPIAEKDLLNCINKALEAD